MTAGDDDRGARRPRATPLKGDPALARQVAALATEDGWAITREQDSSLGFGCKTGLALVVLLTTSLAGVYLLIVHRRANAEATNLRLRQDTYTQLLISKKNCDLWLRGGDEHGPYCRLPPAEGGALEPTGRASIATHPEDLVDAWDHPIYYRCPGPVHTHGWDLISCGPNGIYEEGQGDDIVVGEDLAPEEFARIMTGSAASVTSESK